MTESRQNDAISDEEFINVSIHQAIYPVGVRAYRKASCMQCWIIYAYDSRVYI